MLWLKFPDDPKFHDVAQKQSRITPAFVGFIGTIMGIRAAFHRLESDNSIDLIAPGILEALLWGALGAGVSILFIFIHYWLIKR